jgi:hypothetical protein
VQFQGEQVNFIPTSILLMHLKKNSFENPGQLSKKGILSEVRNFLPINKFLGSPTQIVNSFYDPGEALKPFKKQDKSQNRDLILTTRPARGKFLLSESLK